MKRFPKYQMHLPTLIIAMTTTLGVPHTYATPMSNSISFAVQYSNSSTDTDKILAEARNQIEKSRKEITKQRLVISKQQNTIAKEREQIAKSREDIVLQRQIIAEAEGGKKEKIIAKARKEIEKLHREIERYKNKIAKARAKIDEARALIQVEQDLIAQARDTINSILDSDNDGVTNINDLCLDTPSGTEVDENGCPIPESDWALVWSDEFDGVEIDSSKWTHEVNCSGGGNQERQCYTDSIENSFIENGILKIVAQSASGQPLPYSSARLVSKDQGDWTYGRFEIRAKAPYGQGAWPAIWMLPTDGVYGGWPNSGEIDIFESVNLKVPLVDGGEESHVHGTLHYGKNWPNNDSSGLDYLLPSGKNPADGFHTYAIEWEEGEMRWYVDDVLYQTQLDSELDFNADGEANGLIHKGWYTEQNGQLLWNTAPFDERFHMILNFAVGGSWPEGANLGGIEPSAFTPANPFEIDYVRVYECSVAPSTGQGCATVSPGYLDPVADGGTLVNGKAPTPIPPSDGEITEVIIFENAINPSWPAFVGADSGSYEIVLDQDAVEPDHLDVVEFTFGADPMVAGFNTNISNSPEPYDGSPLVNLGVLEFDLKLVTAPNNATAPWFLKVEQAGNTSRAELPIATPVLGEWRHYAMPLKTLNTAGLDLNGIDVVMVFPAWAQGEGAVFRIDNVTILEGDAPPPVAPTGTDLTDFENAPDSYAFADFDGGVAQVVSNPNLIGSNNIENTSGQVGQMQKFAGQPWGGSTLTLDAPINIPAGTVIGLKVYSERQVPVLFKLEGIGVERTEVHDGNGWQTMSFDFTGDSGNGVPAITLIFQNGTMGNAGENPSEWTFYFDDMVLPGVDDGGSGGGVTINITAGINFEGEQAVWETFENGDPSPPLEFVGNPNASGGNTSNTVAKLALQAAEPNTGMWAGAVSHSVELFTLDNSNAIVKLWVYKDKISPVGVKFERRRGDGWGAHPPRFATNTLINQWEELTIDFTDDIGLPENEAIEGFAIYPDNMDGRAQTDVYFDNVTFSANGDGGGGGDTGIELVVNGTFDNGAEDWIMPGAGMISVEGDSSFFEVNVIDTGPAYSVNLSQVMTLVPDASYEVSFKAKGSVARTMLAGLGLNHAPWDNVVETVALTTQWQTFTYTITTAGFGDDESRVLFDMGAEAGVVFIDDVSVVRQAGPGDGGGTGSGLATIDFESDGVGASFSWTVFENAGGPGLEIVANPMPDPVNASSTVAKVTALQAGAPWVGAESAHGEFGPMTLDASNSTVKIMVYKSVVSDVGIKFAIADGGAQGEIKVANTLVNQWEELSFDFSGNIGAFESINIDQIIVFPDFDLAGRSSDTVNYFDNIRFVSSGEQQTLLES